MLLVALPFVLTLLGATSSMSLGEALGYAREHQPIIRTAAARANAQNVRARIPRAQWQPLLGATAQALVGTVNNTTASYIGAPTVELPRIGGRPGAVSYVSSGKWKGYDSTLAAVGISQRVFDFGQVAAQAAAEDAGIEVEQQDLALQTLNTDFNVEESYYAVHAAKAVLKASEEAFQRSVIHRDFASAGVKSGLRSPIDLTRAEADLARFDIGQIRARGGVVASQSVFAAVVGVSEPVLDVKGPPSPPQEMPSLPAAIAQASTHSPFILKPLARLKAQEMRSHAIGAELRPTLFLSGSLSGRAGGAPNALGALSDTGGYLPDIPNWNVGFVLNIPLFDGVVLARRDASRAVETIRKEELSLAQQQQVAAIEQAFVQVDIARSELPGLLRAQEAAFANYTQADARFRAGLGNSVELADAEALRAEAEIQFALGQFQLARNRASFGRAIAESSRLGSIQ